MIEAFEGGATANDSLIAFKSELAEIVAKKAELDNYITTGLNADLTAATNTFSDYVTSCGTPDAKASAAYDKLAIIKTKLADYDQNVSRPLLQLRRRVLAALNVSAQTTKLTEKYTELENLKKQLDELETATSTAYTREAVIDTRDEAVSFRQTWGYLNRPLRRYSVPILIIFALIFAAAGLYGLTYIAPVGEDGVSPIKTIASLGALIVIVIVVVMKLIKQL